MFALRMTIVPIGVAIAFGAAVFAQDFPPAQRNQQPLAPSPDAAQAMSVSRIDSQRLVEVLRRILPLTSTDGVGDGQTTIAVIRVSPRTQRAMEQLVPGVQRPEQPTVIPPMPQLPAPPEPPAPPQPLGFAPFGNENTTVRVLRISPTDAAALARALEDLNAPRTAAIPPPPAPQSETRAASTEPSRPTIRR